MLPFIGIFSSVNGLTNRNVILSLRSNLGFFTYISFSFQIRRSVVLEISGHIRVKYSIKGKSASTLLCACDKEVEAKTGKDLELLEVTGAHTRTDTATLQHRAVTETFPVSPLHCSRHVMRTDWLCRLSR